MSRLLRDNQMHVWWKLVTLILIWNVFFLNVNFGEVTGPSPSISSYVIQRPQYPSDCYAHRETCGGAASKSGVYKIKPIGLTKPIEVFCDNELDSGGWTVIQRRGDGSIDFNRTWNYYKDGFGFLGSEFWLGNENLAYLTNQNDYQLRVDFTNVAGQTFYITVDHFRISGEADGYSLHRLDAEAGNADSYVEWCPTNRQYETNKCERHCRDPTNCTMAMTVVDPERCICPEGFLVEGDQCIPPEECSCFIPDVGRVLKEGETIFKNNCTRVVNCTDNGLSYGEFAGCGSNAACKNVDGVDECQCNDGFSGDGITCKVKWKDCYELYLDGENTNGVYRIYPTGWEDSGFLAYCEMSTNGGGWTVFQRRTSSSIEFYRGWEEYKNGFGLPEQDHWLGNDQIYALTSQKAYQLRVDFYNSRYHALYSFFNVADEERKYTLSLGDYSGTSGYDAMRLNHGAPFSTHDRDNDGTDDVNCAQMHRGAWWYPERSHTSGRCYTWEEDGAYYSCTYSNLNGYKNSTGSRHLSIFWFGHAANDCNIPNTKMRIRPVQ